jgi:hypothetical protein
VSVPVLGRLLQIKVIAVFPLENVTIHLYPKKQSFFAKLENRNQT